VDIEKEPESTKELYGLNDKATADFGRKCLLARRLVERGVRFIQIYSGTNVGEDWDGAHGDLVYRFIKSFPDWPVSKHRIFSSDAQPARR
jgi:hypothetical protein